jgi:hypothetical protein
VGIASSNAQGKIGQVTTRLDAVTTSANNATIALVKTSAAVSNTAQESRDATRSAGRNASTYVSWTTVLKDYNIGVNNVTTSTKGLTKVQKEAEKTAENAEKAAEKAQKAAEKQAKEEARVAKIKAIIEKQDAIQQALNEKARLRAQKAFEKSSKSAERIAGAFASKLEKARAGLKDIRAEFNEYSSSIKQVITNQLDFQSAFENKGKKTFVDSLVDQANKAKEFAAKIAKLVQLGLSKGSLDKLLAAGADVGGKIADELINNGVGAVQNVNNLVDQIDGFATQLGDKTANAFYGAGLQQGQAFVNGIIAAAQKAGLIYQNGEIKVPNTAAGINRVAARNASASGLATTGSAMGNAGSINITINGAIDPEGTRRQLEKLFQQSSRRTGAVNFAGATL